MIVFFSGKISNSVLVYLARKGWEREGLFEGAEVPFEFLRDPTSWIPAQEIESFLRLVELEFGSREPDLIVKMGHASAELRSWGVLDSVLRMMQKCQDLYAQPQRFISYFVSPAPPIVNLQRGSERVSFDLPIAHNEYPLTVAYLSAALESLPRFFGKENAQVRWRNATVQIDWSEAQNPLLVAEPSNPRPELVESLVRGVEMAQAQVEARDLEIARLEQEMRELKAERQRRDRNRQLALPLAEDERQLLLGKIEEIRENVMKLSDYLTRCQQALTLARTAHRQDPQVQTVLRRIDWDTLRSQFPWLHLQVVEGFENLEYMLDPSSRPTKSANAKKIEIEGLLKSVVGRLQSDDPARLKVVHQSHLARPVALDANRAHVALWQVVSTAAREMNHQGEITLVAREVSGRLEVLVSEKPKIEKAPIDDLPLLVSQAPVEDEALALAADLLAQQNGQLIVGAGGVGRRQFTCVWPIPSAH